MAEFTEVMKQRKRMCEHFKKRCYKCLLSPCNNGKEMICDNFIWVHPQEAEEIIMKWASEHPIKTNADKFKEVFGVKPSIQSCPYVDTTFCQNTVQGSPCDCTCEYYNFWNQEYKEPGEV